MAVINFPDPAGQNPPNTFGPNTTPAATSNGMTYEWTNGSWSIIGGGGGGGLNEGIADTLYVNIDGDNMVGDLTFDTDKITLGTDGTASFAGDITSSSIAVTDRITVNKNPANATAIEIWDKEADPDQRTVRIKGDGSATFAANVNLYDGSIYYAGLQKDTDGSSGNPFGKVYANYGATSQTYFNTSYPEGLRVGTNIGSGDINATIGLDGSASFAGNITVGDNTSNKFLSLQPAGIMMPNGAFLNTDISSEATLKVGHQWGSANLPVAEFGHGSYTGGTYTATTTINRDGSATFAGEVELVGAVTNNTLNTKLTIGTEENLAAGGGVSIDFAQKASNGQNILSKISSTYTDISAVCSDLRFGVTKTNAGYSDAMVIARNGAVKIGGTLTGSLPAGNISLNSDGSATFAGDITSATNVLVGGNALSGAATGTRIRSGGDIQLSASSGGNALLQGYTTGKSTPTVDIKANGNVSFSTDLWCLGCKNETKNILGKAIIVHQGEDDLVSQPSGAAGSRISCAGIIQ